jgi:acetylornithine deacetylase/succinyl-diaminopimelate desuccinylase-like protein
MREADIKKRLDARLSRERAKQLLIELVQVPSPQTELLEDEPLLKEFIRKAIEPRLRTMGFADLRYDAMGNLIATYGTGTSGKSLMFIGNAMNQPASTMPNPYDGDVVDGAKYDLPGECVMGKGASEQKANLAAMLHAMETVIASGVPIAGKLIFTCCLSGETGKHDAIKSVVEGAGVRADMAVLGGTGLKITLGNRGRIDVFVTVKGSPCHSSRPWDGVNAVTGATEVIRLLLSKVKLDQSHPQLGKQSLTVNHIRSFPDSTHTVQERCEFTLDRRLLPGEDPNEAFAEIERIAKEVEQLEDPVSGKAYGVDVRMGPFMYPSLVTTESTVVRALLRASEVMLGKAVETYYSPSAFDQGYLNHMGIPTANFGAGEHQYAHTDYDMASVERTTDSARIYAVLSHVTIFVGWAKARVPYSIRVGKIARAPCPPLTLRQTILPTIRT